MQNLLQRALLGATLTLSLVTAASAKDKDKDTEGFTFKVVASGLTRPTGTMPVKKMMVTVGPDGQMMKKTQPLAHLVVAPKAIRSTWPSPPCPPIV